jgi:hypothetical protein
MAMSFVKIFKDLAMVVACACLSFGLFVLKKVYNFSVFPKRWLLSEAVLATVITLPYIQSVIGILTI